VGKVGVRLTPYNAFLDAFDSNPLELMTHVVREVGKRGVAYVHMIEARVKARLLKAQPTVHAACPQLTGRAAVLCSNAARAT
jgi:hypothetical protein